MLDEFVIFDELMVEALSVERFNGSLTLPPVKLIVVIPDTVLSAMSVPPKRLGLISAVRVVAVMAALADIFVKLALPAVI